ncbi:hypothetical protein BT63DRAFT_246313 [Microthyrium microscopicum]|uniref:Integral membrane protein n=1 Tax=Microthyrium microscopicum TaxID=703497 RepID=A0A6A6U9J8_9PEZI|nr:hypothetical protein BT63DRAFT_246313 [Microthyrium microscopicum]
MQPKNLVPRTSKSRQNTLGALILVVCHGAAAEYVDKFEVCLARVLSVLNGTGTIENITNDTIRNLGFLYTGPVRELISSYPRDRYLTLTYEGCFVLCGNHNDSAQLAEPTFALNMVTTWIFPLAIVLSLPYESLHDYRFKATGTAVGNWLGSPQTALTATIFNFLQIRKAHKRANKEMSNRYTTWNNMYYVLSCVNQFDVTHSSVDRLHLFSTLAYGLYGPVLGHKNRDKDKLETKLLKYLLVAMAHQLRMHRRRAVIPTLASMGTFLIAFVFSVVLSFADVGEHTKVDLLVLGLLFTWLPVLVIFSIVDRNPVSSERTALLMSRWLYNVNAVRDWKISESIDARDIKWWGQPTHEPEDSDQDGSQGQRASEDSPQSETMDDRYELGPFIGQGRQMGFCGLSYALMEELHIMRASFGKSQNKFELYDGCARGVERRLARKPPTSWYITAVTSLSIVWTSILMALLLAYNTPTIGIGCWSGSFLLYGILSTVSWLIQMTRWEGRVSSRICNTANFISLGWLITIVFIMVTGASNTCWCNSLHMFSSYGDYMNFENAAFYREYCNVKTYWAVATGLGLAIPTVSFVLAVFWWLKCQHLWKASETDSDIKLKAASINWVWLI